MASNAMLVAMVLVIAQGQPMPTPKGSRIRTRTGFRAVAAYVFNEHFSALRRTPGADGAIIERLRTGRLAAIVGRKRDSTGTLYFRVATTRRTRGWIDAGALVAPAWPGDEIRLLERIKASKDFARLELCYLMRRHFRPTPAWVEALMLMGHEAEKAAETLTQAAHARKIATRPGVEHRPPESIFLNFESLDRFNRLGIRFRFEPQTERYLYDGDAYRTLMREHPDPAIREAARRRWTALDSTLP
ncbi:MAG: hypothetical protein HY650_13795 [Acidobacteria bacterium]|nr:hypothetical protein [Acidobacteriota bacterium]